MNKSNRKTIFALAIFLTLFTGCSDFEINKTDPVPTHQKLSDVDTLAETLVSQQVAANPSATQPTTSPTTLPATNPSRPPPKSVNLTIAECRMHALQNNLDLKVSLYNPILASESLAQAEAQFEMLFTTNANFSTTDAATTSTLTNAQARDVNVTPGLQIPLRTGGTINLSLPMDRFETNNQFSTLNPAYSSDFNASLNVPLLRGAGYYYNTQGIRIAALQKESTDATTKLAVIRLLTDVDRAYWQLYAARRELEVRLKQRELAQLQLDRAIRQVKAQTLAEVEVVRASSGLADTAGAIITSENNVRQKQRELKRLLHHPDFPIDSDTTLALTSQPTAAEYKLNVDSLIKAALRDRMEMFQVEIQIATESLNVRNAQTDTLPLLSLQYQYSQQGVGKSFGAAYTQLERNRFTNHQVGLQLEVPIGNEAARSKLRASMTRRLQQLATKEQQAQAIQQEVLNSVDTLDLDWHGIIAAQKRVELNSRLVDAETRQFELGLRTSTDVLDAETKLADAQSSAISAITEYQIAQVDIAYATGNTMAATRVTWQTPATPLIRQNP